MSCRDSSPLSSVMISFVRADTGLQDGQITALNHALMKTGDHVKEPTPRQWGNLVDKVRGDFQQGIYHAPRGSRGIENRLVAAHDEPPTARRYYAARNLLSHARAAVDTHKDYLRWYATQRGITEEQAAARFDELYQQASRDKTLTPTTDTKKNPASVLNQGAAVTLRDRSSLYAYEQMNAEARPAETPGRTVQHYPVTSSAIAALGYDPRTGRCEVVMHANPDRVYAYRMTPDEFAAFRDADSVGRHYATQIRHNPDYRLTVDEATDTAYQVRCGTCGQYASLTGHPCAPNGSDEAQQRDIAHAVARRHGRTPPTTPRTFTSRKRERTPFPGGLLSAPDPERVRHEAELAGPDGLYVPVRGTYGKDKVTGDLIVTGPNGYATAGATDHRRALRCTCQEYRATYDCPHVRDITARYAHLLHGGDINTLPIAANPTDTSAPDFAAAASTVTADLQRQSTDAAALAAANAAAFTPAGTRFEEDPDTFTDLYQQYRADIVAYRQARAAGEEADLPVPYLEADAFGGLASPGSKRRFGVEMEFELPKHWTESERQAARARIGRQLRAAGLTPDSLQHAYGTANGDFRTEQANGWRYEHDPTVNGGEIIAPAMEDTEETWRNIRTVCNILTENGAVPDTASLHVHVSTADFDHDVNNYTRLIALSQENEDLMYRMSVNPERGTHRGTGHCLPNPELAGPYKVIEQVTGVNTGKQFAVSMREMSGDSRDHVEFRTSDASFEPAAIQAQIGMAVYLSAAATRPDSIDPDNFTSHRLGEQHAANPYGLERTGQRWDDSTASARRFIDRYVPATPGNDRHTQERVQQVTAMFAATEWVPARATEENDTTATRYRDTHTDIDMEFGTETDFDFDIDAEFGLNDFDYET